MSHTRRTPSALALCLTLTALSGNCLGAESADRNVQPVDEAGQVLSLEQAARLLQSPTEALARMAAAGQIPARQIAGQWRFSEGALLKWLDAGGPGEMMTAGDGQGRPAGDLLADTRGRGTAGEGAARVVGEQPPASSAEVVALRDQGVMLKGGHGSIELATSYGRSESVLPGVSRIEASQATTTLTGRYGLADNLQIAATLPYRSSRNAAYNGGAANSVTQDSTAGDATISLIGVAAAENARHPALILNLQGVAPSGPGDAAIGAGFTLIRNYDPLVLFGGLSYLYGIRPDVNDPDRQLARHNLNFNLGYAYALNETIALSAQFSGSYRTHANPVSEIRPPRERYQLQFGLTYLVSPAWTIEPSVSFGLSAGAPDFSFGLAIPFSF